MEDVIHQCVECDYGIGQAEWHDQELEGTKASYTSHLSQQCELSSNSTLSPTSKSDKHQKANQTSWFVE